MPRLGSTWLAETGDAVIDQQVRSTLPDGSMRYHDGLVRNPDGSYTAGCSLGYKGRREGAGTLERMRVVGGVAGGRGLRAPTGRSIRPTSDRVREAVFNVLSSLGGVEGARVVDLFAGTGALGIEALSRGAAHVTFVDRDPLAIATIRDNLAAVGLVELPSELVRADVLRWLEHTRPGTAFDLALCDPPYDFATWERLLGGLCADLAVLESSVPLAPPPGWVVRTTKRYGGTVVTLVQPLPHQAARKGAS